MKDFSTKEHLNIINNVKGYVDNYSKTLDKICGVLLALCPILQHYEGILFNASITVLVVIVPYFVIRFILNIKDFHLSCLNIVAVMIIYQMFRVINHGTTVTEFGQSMVFIIYMVALAVGFIDLDTLLKTAKCVAIAASICIVLQYITFYALGVHLQFVPTKLLIPSADQWILGAQTGLAGITGVMRNFYRPSAFFLEPSHMYLYIFPHLILLLFNEKVDRKMFIQAIIITVGLILSTSGMAIAFVLGVWGLFVILRDSETGTFSIKNVFKKRNLIALGILVVIFILATIFIPFVNKAVLRIIGIGTGAGAIGGRVSNAIGLIGGMNIKQFILGIADNAHGIGFNMPGFVDALYRHGIIGMVLSYEFYAKSVFKLKNAYVLVALIIIVTSLFSAHTHSTVGMLYYIFILMNGFRLKELQKCRL